MSNLCWGKLLQKLKSNLHSSIYPFNSFGYFCDCSFRRVALQFVFRYCGEMLLLKYKKNIYFIIARFHLQQAYYCNNTLCLNKKGIGYIDGNLMKYRKRE